MTNGLKLLGYAAMLSSASTFAIAQDETETFDLGKIIIKGEKLNRASVDAPTSIAVIDGEAVEAGATDDLDDVLANEANVLADEGLQPPAIRGVEGMGGSGTALTAGSQPRIPIVVDGTAMPSGDSSYAFKTSVWDIDTVEVARGPQATSTGRNAIGGAIRVFSNDPVFHQEGALRLRFSSENDAGLDFMLNTPLIADQLAFRLTGELTNGQSYINNLPNPLPSGIDPNDEAVRRLRAKLLYEPEAVPGLSILLNAEINRSEGPAEGIYFGDIQDLTLNNPMGFGRSNNIENLKHDVISLQTTYDFNDSVTAFARVSKSNNTLRFLDSQEVTSLGENLFDKKLTEVEAYLQFQDLGILTTGVLGVIHSNEKETGGNSGAFLPFAVQGDVKNSAIYGEVELDAGAIAPGLAVILGGRYEHNKLSRSVVAANGTPIGSTRLDERVFLPKFALRYDINDQTAIGYTYSEGYRSAGLDVDLLAPAFSVPYSASAFGSERIKNHEIYGKTTIANGALDLRASAFFYKWKDAQVPGAGRFANNPYFPALGNVPEAQGYGAELSATYRATDRLSFDANLGLLHTEITRVASGQSGLLGHSLPRAPETTASIGVNYASGNGFTASAQARFVGERRSVLMADMLSSYTIVDASVGYETDWNGNTVVFDAYVNNLFDVRNKTYDNRYITAVGAPRTVGASMTLKF